MVLQQQLVNANSITQVSDIDVTICLREWP